MKFKGKPVTVDKPRQEVYDRVSNLERYNEFLDRLPDDVRQRIGQVRFTPDAIIVNAAPVGEITLRVADRIPPESMRLEAENAPVPLAVNVAFNSEGECVTVVAVDIEVEIPAMMRPFIVPRLQEVADKMGELLANLLSV